VRSGLNATRLLLVNFGGAAEAASLKLLLQLRAAGLAAEIYPDAKVKPGKQFQYAEKLGFSHAITIGDQEVSDGVCNLKHLGTRTEQRVPLSEIVARIFQSH
jgi:histidyl-tRNA synthetase